MANDTETINDTEIRESNPGRFKKIMSLVGLVLMIGSVAVYAILVRPMWDEHGELKADVTSKQDRADELELKLSGFKDAEDKMDIGTEVQKMTLLNSIPVGVNQDGVIEDLVDIADLNNIQLRSVSFGLSEGAYADVGALRINASFEGNYSDLINFLEGIEENSRLFKVTSINVQVNSLEDLDIKKVTFSLSIEAFYQG